MTTPTDETTIESPAPGDGPGGDVEVESSPYAPPRLTYVGNVHSLLAGQGSIPVPDTHRGSINKSAGQ